MATDLQARVDTLTSEINENKAKYIYFLLAAAGASLGFGLQKLDGQARNWVVSLALAADACWVASIFCGCLLIDRINRIQTLNLRLVDMVQKVMFSKLGVSVRRIQEPLYLAKITSNTKTASRLKRAQFWLLAAGVLAFAAWRVIVWWQTAPVAAIPG